MLWRRLDAPGHDACCLEQNGAGQRLVGAAVFSLDKAPTQLVYRVECDAEWRTERGTVAGWIGRRSVDVIIERSRGGWTLNGAPVSGLDTCVDLDLGFTPATNLLPIRRLALAVGDAGEASAAWLDVATCTLGSLAQRYERRSPTSYWYQAPSVGYEASLVVTEAGFVRRYPGLWEAES